MKIIRKRLEESEVSGDPTRIRFNTTTHAIQTSPDGGVTWVDNPQADPRIGSTFTKPPLGTGTAQCDSAANRIKWVHDFVDATVHALTVTGEIFVVANVALEFAELLFFDAGVLVDLFMEFGSIAVGVGASALDAAFTTGVYDALFCLFFCDGAGDGSYNQTQLDQLVADVDSSADINATAQLMLDAIFFFQGVNGVNNAGMVGGQTGDCSGCTDCRWCFKFNSVEGWGDWVARGGNATFDGTNWNSVVSGDSAILSMKIEGFASSHITSVTVCFYTSVGPADEGFRGVYFDDSASTPPGASTNLAGSTGENEATVTYSVDTSYIGIDMDNSHVTSPNQICQVYVEGTGDCPFGEPNC